MEWNKIKIFSTGHYSKIITRNGQPERGIVCFYSTPLGERWTEEYNEIFQVLYYLTSSQNLIRNNPITLGTLR